MVTVTEHCRVKSSPFSNIFPFAKSSERQVRLLYGLCPTNQGKVDSVIAHYGNYIALVTLRERRLSHQKSENKAPRAIIALRGFLDLPLDIIHETLGWTHPIELYNLIRTNRAIRQMLLTRNACSVWRDSYNTHSDVPYPSDRPDYPRWTTFLFGPDICQGCGCRGAVINICFRWKMCTGCTQLRCEESDNISFSLKIVKYGGQHLERLVRSLLVSIQHSDTIFSIWTPSYCSRRDLKSKTRNIISHLRYLQARPNKTTIDQRYEAKLAKDALFRKEARRLETWAESILDSAREYYEDDINRYVVRMAKYLYKQYDRTIINSLKQSIGRLISDLVRKNRLKVPNNQAARKYLLLLKPELDYLAQQSQRDVELRHTRLLESLYNAICEQHSLSVVDSGMENKKPEWKIFEQTLDEGTLQDLRCDPERKSFSTHIRLRIHTYLDEWLEEEKKRLLDALSGTLCLETCSLPNGKQDAIRLATAVFHCCNHHYIHSIPSSTESLPWYPSHQTAILGASKAREQIKPDPLQPIFFGWGQAYEHTLNRDHTNGVAEDGNWDATPQCAFSDDLYRIMVYMLGLLGVDPTTAMDSDLDRLDARFVCLSCRTRGRSMKGKLPMRWRECAIHIYNRSCRGIDDHKYVQVAVLTEEAMKIVRKYERPLNTSESWRCFHCNQRFFRLKHVLNHVQQEHNIHDPIVFSDYFALPSYESEAMIPRNAFRVVLDANFCCQRCVESRKTRLWRMKDLEKHLKDLHGIHNGALEDDYSRVELVATSSCVLYQSIMDIRSRVV